MQNHKIGKAYQETLDKIKTEKEILFNEINKLAEKSNTLTKKVRVLEDEKFKLETENKTSKEKSIEGIKQDKYDFLIDLKNREKNLYNSKLKLGTDNELFSINKNKLENKTIDLLKRENIVFKKEKDFLNKENFLKVEKEKIFLEKNKIISNRENSEKFLKESEKILKRSEKKVKNDEGKIKTLKEEFLHKIEILEKQKEFFNKKDVEIENEKLLIKSEWSQIKNAKKLI